MVKNLKDKRFGRLVAKEHVGFNKSRNALWRCECDCGNEKVVASRDLQELRTQSCGCYQQEQRGAYKKLPSGIAAMRALYLHYKRKTKERGIYFNLSVEDFHKITSLDCVYCGTAPAQEQKIKNNTGSYFFNGVDRVDSSIGYVIDNCVPCCWTCNRAKGNLSVKDFKEWIQRVYQKSMTSVC